MHRQRQGASAHGFGVKVSIATTLHHSKGGQLIAHAKALPGNPYDGHTLETVIPGLDIGASLSRIIANRGDIRATTPRPTIASRFISRGVASPNTSSASCADVQPSNRSSATPKASIGWAEITSLATMRSTPSSPPPDITSEGCWHGWRSYCRRSCSLWRASSRIKKSDDRRVTPVLHGRPIQTRAGVRR